MHAAAKIDRPFGLPELIKTVVDLPFPPSVNRIWRANPQSSGKQVHLSQSYIRWKRQADLLAIASRVYRGCLKIDGPFEAHIALDVTAGAGDLDNRVKAVLDWAQSREMVKNDRDCRRLTVEWVEHVNAPEGCRLTLRELVP